jgi:hypothetical protein
MRKQRFELCALAEEKCYAGALFPAEVRAVVPALESVNSVANADFTVDAPMLA